MSNTLSPRTVGGTGKAAARSQAHAAHLTIPLMLNAGNDMQHYNQPITGHEHQSEGGDSPAQAPALHTTMVAGATAVDVSADQCRNSPTVSVAGKQGGDFTGLDASNGYSQEDLTTPLGYLNSIISALDADSVDPEQLRVFKG